MKRARSQRPKRPEIRSRRKFPPTSTEGTTKALELLMSSIGDLLHPTLYQRLLLKIGERLGHYFHNRSQIQKTSDPRALGEYVETLLRREGWDISRVTQEHSGGKAEFTIRSCPFGELGGQDSHVCMLEQGLFQGLAKPFVSSPKVHVVRGSGVPPRECRVNLSLNQPEKDQITGAGPTHSLGPDMVGEVLVNHGVSGVISKLTDREREVLILIGDGLSDKAIADVLRISVRTVQGHGARIRYKLGIRSRTELLRLSILQKFSHN